MSDQPKPPSVFFGESLAPLTRLELLRLRGLFENELRNHPHERDALVPLIDLLDAYVVLRDERERDA